VRSSWTHVQASSSPWYRQLWRICACSRLSYSIHVCTQCQLLRLPLA
jgi:hypothetical protein